MAPFKGPLVFSWLVRSHAVVMMMVVVMVMLAGLCARDRGDGERHGGEGGQNESKLLHRKSLLGMDSFSARKMTNPPVHVKRIFMNGHSGRNAPSRSMIWIASVRGEQNCTRPGLPPHVLARELVVTWRVWQRASLCPVIFLHGRPVAKSADRPPSAGRAAFPSAAASRCG
jgi:hypothetical protein